MPAISIDTFFACTLMITVIVAAMAMTAKIIQPYIDSIENLNQTDYLKELADQILLSTGEPQNWGSNRTLMPEIFGLAKNNSLVPYELDVDKVCRLNPENAYHISYPSLLESLKIKNVALRISITQIIDISITPIANQSSDSLTNYTFQIKVKEEGLPVSASLHCYMLAKNFLSGVYTNTNQNGEATVSFAIPNDSNGTALLVAFARNSQDERIAGYATYSFGHLSESPPPNRSFVELSPLDYRLYVNKLYDDATLLEAYALTYSYNKTLTLSNNSAYDIPEFLDKSPMMLVVTGTNSSDYFVEWTAYPQIPLEMGANMQGLESSSFLYIVSINEVLYKVRIQCEGPSG